MKKIIFLLLCGILLFGCIDGGEKPPVEVPDENETDGDITVVVEPQQNDTVTGNETPEEPPDIGVDPGAEIEYTQEPDSVFTIYFIHVGDEGFGVHGDAILIKKGDFDALIDAGPSETAGRVIDFLKSRNIDDLDVLMLTNGDPEHYGGVPLIASEYDIEEFWWAGGVTFADEGYENAIDAASSKAELTREIEYGYSRTLNGLTFDIINPPHAREEDVQNDAIVTRLSDRNFSILLTSGIRAGTHGRLANEEADMIKVDVLQAPDHGLGSGTSNIGIFLVTSNPDVAIISGSADDSPEAGGSRDPFKRYLEQYDIELFETYANGTVRITSDGYDYSIAYLG